MDKRFFTTSLFALLILLAACKKEFLDAKPNDNLVVPTGVNDMQAILDNDMYMNGAKNNYGPDPSLALAGVDDYYLPLTAYNNLTDYNKAIYTWAKVVPWPSADKNWKAPYRVIFYANSALDGLKGIQPTGSEMAAYNNVKGSACFFRAYQFFNLAQLFTAPYDAATATNSLGIPLRLTADISELSHRSTVKETYDQIISDLNTAVSLLPNKALFQTRPSKPAAYALLARVNLIMGNYAKAISYCDSALQINSKLLDYNSISPTQAVPFAALNDEVLFHCSATSANSTLSSPSSSGLRIDTNLIASYKTNDLRPKLLFKMGSDGKYLYKGFYSGTTIPFTGIANDEIYLMQAEAYARTGNAANALKDLNLLLRKRYNSTSFADVTATDANDALIKILEERRKELPFRGLRWMDIRRLNKDGRNISLVRNVNGIQYNLFANDPKFTWPIPDDVIGLTGMPQNPR